LVRPRNIAVRASSDAIKAAHRAIAASRATPMERPFHGFRR
jgi:hypothetical protein